MNHRDRLTVGLVALGNQERVLVLEILARRAASPVTVQALLRNAESLIEAPRSDGRPGYERAAEATLAFSLGFRTAYFLHRRLGILRFLADRLGDRFEMLLVTRLLIQELLGADAGRSRTIFGENVVAEIRLILEARLEKTISTLDVNCR